MHLLSMSESDGSTAPFQKNPHTRAVRPAADGGPSGTADSICGACRRPIKSVRLYKAVSYKAFV